MNLITPLFTLYKTGDQFYPALNQEFASVQDIFTRYSLALMEETPESIAASIIQGSMFPVIEKGGSSNEMKVFLREHFFDLIVFKDPRLLNSPIITKTILDYLGLFRDPSFNQSQQEDNFILAIDEIMEASSADPVVYDFVLNFLVDGFQRFQMEKVLVHIAENFIEGGCETDSKKLLQKRLEGYEKMAPGKKAPDILMLDQNGKQVRLYDIDRDYTLVLFWASWCPHCATFLKQLGAWYPGRSIDLEVFAVSIDSSRFSWEETVLMDNYPWINTFSGAGWDGKAPKDYNVYATPTLFLLDREHRIVAKPMTFREFKKEVEGR
jgi:thiol-disulfide isomerase/thioredoxin